MIHILAQSQILVLTLYLYFFAFLKKLQQLNQAIYFVSPKWTGLSCIHNKISKYSRISFQELVSET
jgi:hypothetical protein